MKEHFIDLNDGTRIQVAMNFGTLFYLQKNGGTKLLERLDHKQKNNKKITDDESMDVAAKLVHALLRSNGKNATFDEALMLMPADVDEVRKIIDTYQDEVEKLKKKQKAKESMKMHLMKR